MRDYRASRDNAAGAALRTALEATPLRTQKSVLLEWDDHRSQEVSIADVRRKYNDSAVFGPSGLDQRIIAEFDRHLFAHLPAQTSVLDLSPVGPFGATTALTGLDQKMTLSTIRNSEVVSDALISLTLAAGATSAGRRSDQTWLATSHREIRMQQHRIPGFTPHFRAFSLLSAEECANADDFKRRHMTEHMSFYIEVLTSWLSQQRGVSARLQLEIGNVRLMEIVIRLCGLHREEVVAHTQVPDFSVFRTYGVPLPPTIGHADLQPLIDGLPAEFARLRGPLRHIQSVFGGLVELTRSSEVDVSVDLERLPGLGYYEDCCAKLSVRYEDGDVVPLVDLGTNDWLQRLVERPAMRLMTGGLGSELFLRTLQRRKLTPNRD